MNFSLKTISKTDLQHLCMLVFCVALVYSKYVLSVSFFALGLLTLIDFDPAKGKLLSINRAFFRDLKKFLIHPAFISISLILAGTILSGINSENTNEWLMLVRRKTPYLALPIIFFMMKPFNQRVFKNFTYFFLLLMWISSLGVSIVYITHYYQFTYQIGFGQPVPTPIAHNIYSLFLCFASVSGILLIRDDHYFKFKKEKYLIWSATLFIMMMLHLLSVRIGLFAFYLCVFILLVQFLVRTKRYKLALVLLPLIILTPYLAIKFIPSLNNKFYYTMHDFRQWKKGSGMSYSDTGRFQSMEVGLKLWKKNILFGTGLGDLKSETISRAEELYPENYRGLKPHNQWIYLLAGSGIAGAILFALGFFIPVLYQKAYKNDFLLYLTIILLFSFMVESSLERSYSIAFHLFFLLLALRSIPSYPRDNEQVSLN